jgi:hypothetical protein
MTVRLTMALGGFGETHTKRRNKRRPSQDTTSHSSNTSVTAVPEYLLLLTVSWPVNLGVGHPFEAQDHISIFSYFTVLSSHRAHSLARGRVCSLQWNHLMIRVVQGPWPHFTVSSETLPPEPGGWGPPYLHPQKQDGPVISPGTGFPGSLSVALQWRYSRLTLHGDPCN